ncbi:MAG: hypothetical protein JJD93_03250 [Ilumatobacteraceae bacterium]|nr:hypothetical protein [Ilumatobacteraceae bacterium]
MEIIRHDDGSLTVPVAPNRHANDDEDTDAPVEEVETTMVLHPGEGGYSEALAEWDAQQNPDHEVVSTASGREQAMHVVHAVADDPDHVAEAVESLEDPAASADALRHVLIGGTPSIQAFAGEVAEAEGGDELPHHKATKIIGEVLAEIDTHQS